MVSGDREREPERYEAILRTIYRPRPSCVGPVVAGVALAQLLLAGVVRCAFFPEAFGCRATLVVGFPVQNHTQMRNVRGPPEKQSSSEASYDERDAEKLWEVSEELTGSPTSSSSANPPSTSATTPAVAVRIDVALPLASTDQRTVLQLL